MEIDPREPVGMLDSLYILCGVYACQSSFQCTLKWMPFVTCKLYSIKVIIQISCQLYKLSYLHTKKLERNIQIKLHSLFWTSVSVVMLEFCWYASNVFWFALSVSQASPVSFYQCSKGQSQAHRLHEFIAVSAYNCH